MSPPSLKHRYTKEEKVGEGQYAVVYLGKQSGTNRIVAIKSIKIGQFKDGRLPSPFPSNIRNGYVCHPRNKISSRAAA